MDSKDLKKLLAGLGVVGLISAGGITLPGAHAGSGWGAQPSAGSADKAVEKAAGSGWSGNKDSAVSAVEDEAENATATIEEEVKEKVEEAADTVEEKATGGSGWSGSK